MDDNRLDRALLLLAITVAIVATNITLMKINTTLKNLGPWQQQTVQVQK